jgi:osmotically-inducible protein OsmY
MANRDYRGGRGRYDRDRYNRQEEQFDSTDYNRRESYGQMGEGSWRDDEYHSDESAGQPYSRLRDFSRDRGYVRGSSDYARSEPSEYPSGRYGPNPYEPRQTTGFASFTGSDQGGRDFTAPRYTGDRSYSSDYGGYGAGTQLTRGRGSYGDDGERGWFERAGDEVASWFGDEDATRRREQDHRGKGPSGYTRSDERIQEDANDRLTDDWSVDASSIQVSVSSGELTLDGTVTSRDQKHRAEDCVEDISGVKHVQNNLRVQQANTWDRNTQGTSDTTM